MNDKKKLISPKQLTQLCGLVAQAVPANMDSTTAQGWIENPDALRRGMRGLLCPPVATVQKQKFVVADHFDPHHQKAKEAGIIWLGNNFQKWFLPLEEEITGEIILPKFHHDLDKVSSDEDILKDLGGKAQVEKNPSTMRGVYEVIKKQSHGEDGALKNNGCANIFYVSDKVGGLRAVHVDRNVGGWNVCACLVGDPYGWNAGCRVFAGNS